MPFHLRLYTSSANAYEVAIEQIKTGLFFDFSTSKFVSSPATQYEPLSLFSKVPVGIRSYDLANTPVAVWADGAYAAYVIDTVQNQSVSALPFTMIGGDCASAGVLGFNGLDLVVIDSNASGTETIQARQTLATLLAFATNLNEAGLNTLVNLPLSLAQVASVAETATTRIATLNPPA